MQYSRLMMHFREEYSRQFGQIARSLHAFGRFCQFCLPLGRTCLALGNHFKFGCGNALVDLAAQQTQGNSAQQNEKSCRQDTDANALPQRDSRGEIGEENHFPIAARIIPDDGAFCQEELASFVTQSITLKYRQRTRKRIVIEGSAVLTGFAQCGQTFGIDSAQGSQHPFRVAAGKHDAMRSHQQADDVVEAAEEAIKRINVESRHHRAGRRA